MVHLFPGGNRCTLPPSPWRKALIWPLAQGNSGEGTNIETRKILNGTTANSLFIEQVFGLSHNQKVRNSRLHKIVKPQASVFKH
jgi:hypothetical protein